ncbi:MAG: hypothetical protein VXX85_01250 [Candidatus Margulisiibacteriota bacterium]|nr:hypothetical protein [Candidatus Margulisiibacteriota bacterium]
MNHISFGTSGHRGIIGKSFTRNHLIAIAKAIGAYFKSNSILSPKVLIGYDTRTGNSPTLEDNSYTFALIQTLKDQKIRIDFCDNYAPTPIISWSVKTYDYDMGIILTASHNPPNYNGIKINDKNGAPASIKLTNWIQAEANKFFTSDDAFKPQKKTPNINQVNYTKPFISHLTTLLKNEFQLPFPDFANEYVIDPKCGSAIEVWKVLTADSIGVIHWINDNYNSDFNFKLPNPTSQETINELGEICKAKNCIGLSNDPDADRHALIDEEGDFVSPEKIAAIIINYLYISEIAIESVSTTLANSTLVKNICSKYKIQLHETNIGFKYFTPYLLNAFNKRRLAIGVESSGGFSISLHSFDKCGFLPLLIIMGIMKKRSKSLADLTNEINDIHNTFYFEEDAAEVNYDFSNVITKRLKSNQSILSDLFDLKIKEINTDDGLKIIFDNFDWVLCRPSGTEPLVRIYAESTNGDQSKLYVNTIKQLLLTSKSE